MFLSADKIHSGKQWLPKNSVLEIDEKGKIIALHQSVNNRLVQHFEGTLCPGFVNTHCHIELSHMKGLIPEHTGLTQFLLSVMRTRNDFTEEQKSIAQAQAVNELIGNGVVAVGDIANTTDTLSLRQKSNLHWYTFVESIGFLPERASKSFDIAHQLWTAFAAQKSSSIIRQQSIVPHAPYSVSKELFALIAAHQNGKTISIHNQETAAEQQYFENKMGDFVAFFKEIGIDDSAFSATAQSSLQSYANWLSAQEPLILVHNTFSSKEDIQFVQERFSHLFWCLCPNANLYIENSLPDISLLQQMGSVICIGTDSLASNHQLSVMEELLSIHKHFPEIAWEQLLRWGTYNGACALQMQDTIGSFEPNKTPGIVWIKNDNSLQKIY
jgi:aminodeoxyfutalosine deaminase